MRFTYYFDAKKKEILNCNFNIIEITEEAEGMRQIVFEASIEEIKDTIKYKKEKLEGVFHIPPTDEDTVLHDVDFSRIRHAGSNKWIFTIINAKNTNETAMVGLITTTLNKNPVGVDVYNETGELDAELSENNLAVLDASYIPPLLTQTVVDSDLRKEELPVRFTSITARFDASESYQIVKDFRQDFREEIPAGVPFKMEMKIAPLSVDPIDTERIFDFNVPNLGRVTLSKTSLDYLIHNGLGSDTVRVPFERPVTLEDFYLDNKMTIKANFKIEGDGEGNLTVNYCNTTLTSVYDHEKEFSYIHFRGAHIGKII